MKLKAFTLIELIIVITIMMIIMMMTYAPYAHHQKKTLLKQAAREISQSLSDARNLAIHGLDTGSGNLDILLYFDSGATEIVYYAYPFNEMVNINNLQANKIYKTKKLPVGIQVDSFNSVPGEYLLKFNAISGSGSIQNIEEFPIKISYKGSVDSVLQQTILYYPQTYISDY